MKNNQNVIIAIALSFLVIVGWQFFIIGPKLEARAAAPRSRAVAADADARAGHVRDAGRRRPAAAGCSGAPHRAERARRSRLPARRSRRVPRDAALATTRARQDRHAVAQRLDQPDRRAHRRPAPRRLSRDRRADEPAGRALLAGRQRAPLLRRFRLGRAAGRTGRARQPNGVDRRGRTARAGQGRDAHLGQRRRASSSGGSISVDEKYMFTVRQSVENTTGAPVDALPLRRRQPHRACRRSPATTSCTRA